MAAAQTAQVWKPAPAHKFGQDLQDLQDWEELQKRVFIMGANVGQTSGLPAPRYRGAAIGCADCSRSLWLRGLYDFRALCCIARIPNPAPCSVVAWRALETCVQT